MGTNTEMISKEMHFYHEPVDDDNEFYRFTHLNDPQFASGTQLRQALAGELLWVKDSGWRKMTKYVRWDARGNGTKKILAEYDSKSGWSGGLFLRIQGRLTKPEISVTAGDQFSRRGLPTPRPCSLGAERPAHTPKLPFTGKPGDVSLTATSDKRDIPPRFLPTT